MNSTNPEEFQKRVAEQKAAYWANKGKKEPRMVALTVCRTCESSIGTFQKTPDGKSMYHVNCPGPRRRKPIPVVHPENSDPIEMISVKHSPDTNEPTNATHHQPKGWLRRFARNVWSNIKKP